MAKRKRKKKHRHAYDDCGGCRDCAECTRSVIGALILAPFKMLWALCFAWNIGLFMKTCPRCDHHLTYHQTVGKDNTYRD